MSSDGSKESEIIFDRPENSHRAYIKEAVVVPGSEIVFVLAIPKGMEPAAKVAQLEWEFKKRFKENAPQVVGEGDAKEAKIFIACLQGKSSSFFTGYASLRAALAAAEVGNGACEQLREAFSVFASAGAASGAGVTKASHNRFLDEIIKPSGNKVVSFHDMLQRPGAQNTGRSSPS